MATDSSKRVKLTNTTADKAEVTAKRYVVWDAEQAGFGLRIESTGSKSWVVKYRAGHGRSAKQRFMIIGRFPAVEAADARKEAKRLLSGKLWGHDPAADRKRQREQLTVAQLVDLYEAEGCYVQRGIRKGKEMKPLTKRYTMARLRHHVVRLLGTRPAAELTPGDIETLAQQVTAGKSAKPPEKSDKKRGLVVVRGGEGAARKAQQSLKLINASPAGKWARAEIEQGAADPEVIKRSLLRNIELAT